MGTSKSYKGAGPAGSDEQAGVGPGKSISTKSKPDKNAFGTEDASSSKGAKPKRSDRKG